MRVSIVIAVLNSPEVVRRQALYWAKMPLPDDAEVIIVDDKSDPPLKAEDYALPRFRLFRQDIPAQWTQPAARNLGVREAKGEYVICTDIDHILTRPLIDIVRATDLDMVKFKREVAILDEDGNFVQTPKAVFEYGFEKARYASRQFRIAPHTNSFAMRRSLYLELGGVSEHRVGTGLYPNREEIPLRRKIKQLREAGKVRVLDEDSPDGDNRPTIYMIPNGKYCGSPDYNPFGLFHNLSRGR